MFGRPLRWRPPDTVQGQMSDGLLPPSPPAEKATACQDQAGKASTDDGAGNWNSTFDGNVVDRYVRWRKSDTANRYIMGWAVKRLSEKAQNIRAGPNHR